MAIRGLKGIQEKSAEINNFANQNRMKYLYVGDGDTALLRFIDDEEMLQTKIHEYEELQPTGKKYRKAYCSDNLVGTPCKWCAAGNVSKSVYVFLAYVYFIVHKTQNPDLNKNPDAVKWETIKQGNQILYKENVGEVRILRMKYGKDGYLKNSILQFVEEYSTLTDRDYKFSRTGSSIKTLYSFVPKDASPMSDEVIKAKKEAPSIEEIIMGPKGDAKVSVVAVEEEESETKADAKGSDKEVEDLF